MSEATAGLARTLVRMQRAVQVPAAATGIRYGACQRPTACELVWVAGMLVVGHAGQAVVAGPWRYRGQMGRGIE